MDLAPSAVTKFGSIHIDVVSEVQPAKDAPSDLVNTSSPAFPNTRIAPTGTSDTTWSYAKAGPVTNPISKVSCSEVTILILVSLVESHSRGMSAIDMAILQANIMGL